MLLNIIEWQAYTYLFEEVRLKSSIFCLID